MGISDATYYNWKKKYGGLGVLELRRLLQLEEENRRLKQLVADLSLDKVMLQDIIQKEALRPTQRKALVGHLHEAYRVILQRACRLLMHSSIGDAAPAVFAKAFRTIPKPSKSLLSTGTKTG